MHHVASTQRVQNAGLGQIVLRGVLSHSFSPTSVTGIRVTLKWIHGDSSARNERNGKGVWYKLFGLNAQSDQNSSCKHQLYDTVASFDLVWETVIIKRRTSCTGRRNPFASPGSRSLQGRRSASGQRRIVWESTY